MILKFNCKNKKESIRNNKLVDLLSFKFKKHLFEIKQIDCVRLFPFPKHLNSEILVTTYLNN